MHNTTVIQIRQGDVLIEYRATEELPPDAREVPLDPERGLVLAEGEITGHAHRIPHRHAVRAAAAFSTKIDQRFLRITAPVPLRHEEHKTRCAVCKGEDDHFVIATVRLADRYDRDGYLCQEHAVGLQVVQLAEPGATDLPVGVARVTIDSEYQPGEFRDVAD